MKFWKTAALGLALAGAAAAGAALAPVAEAQGVRVVTPRADVFTLGGARIGISVRDLEGADLKNAPSSGVLVDAVDEGSPAEKAGLRKGDVIVEFDGERVRSVRQFTRLVGETPAGRTVTAAVQRDGQRVSVNVTPRESDGFRVFDGDGWRVLEELRASRVPPRAPAAPAPPRPPVLDSLLWRGGTQIGVTVTELSPQLADYFGTSEGVLVSAVRDDSAAARAGVKAGDVITSVNGAKVQDGAELRRQIQRLDAGQEFTLGIVRDKRSLTLKGKVESTTSRSRAMTRTII